jgi:hypothetical protein
MNFNSFFFQVLILKVVPKRKVLVLEDCLANHHLEVYLMSVDPLWVRFGYYLCLNIFPAELSW